MPADEEQRGAVISAIDQLELPSVEVMGLFESISISN
jgi:hypothetical protein